MIVQYTDAATGRHYTADLAAAPAVESTEDGLVIVDRSALLAPGTASPWKYGDPPAPTLLARATTVTDPATGAMESLVTVHNGVTGSVLHHLVGHLAIAGLLGVTVTATVGPDEDWTGYPGSSFVWRDGTQHAPAPGTRRAAALAFLLRDAPGIAGDPHAPLLVEWLAGREVVVTEHPQHGVQGSAYSTWADHVFLAAGVPLPGLEAWADDTRAGLRAHVAWWVGHRGHQFVRPDGQQWTVADGGECGWDGGWRLDPNGLKDNGAGGVVGSNGQASYEAQHLRGEKLAASWILTGDIVALRALRSLGSAVRSCGYVGFPGDVAPVGSKTGGEWRQCAWIWRFAALWALVDGAAGATPGELADIQLVRMEHTPVIATDDQHVWYMGLCLMGLAWLRSSAELGPAFGGRALEQIRRVLPYVLKNAPPDKLHVTPPELHVDGLLLAARALAAPEDAGLRAAAIALGKAHYAAPDSPTLVAGKPNFNAPADAGWLALGALGVRV